MCYNKTMTKRAFCRRAAACGVPYFPRGVCCTMLDPVFYRALSGVIVLLSLLAPISDGASYRPYFDQVRGEWLEGRAQICWAMADATGSIAFRVWRMDGTDKQLLDHVWLDVNVFGIGSAIYRVTDSDARRGDQAAYWIEELTTHGETRFWGPWTVTFDEPIRPLIPATAVLSPMEPMPFSDPPAGPAVNVAVREHDIYTVSYAAIADGLGLSNEAVTTMIAEGNLVMRHETNAVAFVADSVAQQIWFYGWPVNNRYTRDNIFWIEPGDGIYMNVAAPALIEVGSNLTHTATLRFKEDAIMLPDHFSSLPEDFYFWKWLSGNNVTYQEKTLDLPLWGHAGGDVELIPHIEGFNRTLISPNHHAVFWVNTNEVGEVYFDGKEIVTPLLTIDASEIQTALNEFKIQAFLLPDRHSSWFFLKHFDVSYERYYAPAPAALVAGTSGHDRLSADRFNDAVVLDITNPYAPVRIALADGSLPAGYSWPTTPDSLWLFRERADVQPVDVAPAGHGAWMRDGTNRVDYLVITPRVFEAPATNLATYRAAQGLRTAVAFYEDICDQFAHGLNTPEAIRSMIQYAHAAWEVAPRMALLAGWGHFDYLGVVTNEPNHLPPLLAPDSKMLRPSDGLFADLTGDEVPEIAVGRLPVQTVAQFEHYLAKLQAYESAGWQAAHQTASFFADNADGNLDFEASNLNMSGIAEDRYTIVTNVLVPGQVAQMRSAMTNALQTGHGVFHFTGHGTYQQLAAQNVLHSNDVNAMGSHPPVPLFMALTCYIGRFDHHSIRSLSETLLLKSDGGALAVYAPSGLSENYYGEQFGMAFYSQHATGRYDTLGLALLAAAQALGPPTEPLEAESRRMYNLLGDPALKLRGAEGGDVPASIDQFALWRWEKFSMADLANPAVSGPDADPDNEGQNNFSAYAFGGLDPLIHGDFNAWTGNTVYVEWNERIAATDLDYALKWTDDLSGDWYSLSPNVNIIRALTADGSSMRTRAEIPLDEPLLFFRLQVSPQ